MKTHLAVRLAAVQHLVGPGNQPCLAAIGLQKPIAPAANGKQKQDEQKDKALEKPANGTKQQGSLLFGRGFSLGSGFGGHQKDCPMLI